jgi:flagellar protein FliO/FliZ
MEDVSIISLFIRLVFSLGVVIGLMVIAGRMLRRRGVVPGRATARASLEVVARQSIGRTASVAVVRVADRAFVVGVTEQSVQLLGETDPDSLVQEVDGSGADRTALPGGPIGSGRTWKAMIETLRERTVRRS